MTKDERLKPVFTEIYKIFVDTSISFETIHELLEDIIEFTKVLSLSMDDDDDVDEEELSKEIAESIDD